MSPCPICQKPVDSLRARHVGVREGKVVAYCSAECQARAAALNERAEAAAAAAAATPAASAPAPGPAGKRSRTPAAGVKASRTPAAGVPVTEAAPAKAPPAEAAAPAAARQTERKITAAALAAVADAPAKADDPSASGIRRHRRRMDNLAADSAWDELDDEPAEPVTPRGRKRAEGEPGGRRLWPALLVLAVLGGGGFLVYRTFFQAGTGAPPAADAPPPADAPADAAPTPEQQRASALERATSVLRTYAKAEVPAGEAAGAQALARRMAASALSRTGDTEAIAILAGLFEKEPIESARLEIAYDLARAGDPRGTERLVAALAHKNVERRYEAARWLALLGDQRAVPVLAGAMEFGQLRLQAAGALAYLAHPGALKLLEQTRAAPGATDEDKAKATIALGRAKRATADELRALLADKRNAEAAAVLAELGDVPARFTLSEQLGYEHSRVEAARALRRFGDAGDQLEGLRTLLAALGGDGATSRIRAAEAILLLAGPATWSERM